MIKIGIIGEYNQNSPSHLSTKTSIDHSRKLLGINIQESWISTNDIDLTLFNTYSGIWIAPGSPYKNMNKTLLAIQYARENNIPCFGTCGGFQHMIIEYARNVLGHKDAAHAEYDPYASNLFISPLSCSLVGKEMRIRLKVDSSVSKIYQSLQCKEKYYCNFGLNPHVLPLFKNCSLQIVGLDSEGEARVVELQHHKFFIGTLFVPQISSTQMNPHPLVVAFLNSCL